MIFIINTRTAKNKVTFRVISTKYICYRLLEKVLVFTTTCKQRIMDIFCSHGLLYNHY